MNKKITFLLVLFLILDTCYSFYQHYYLPHDGDMAAIIVPGEWYADVLKDPFGFSVLTEGRSYSGTNRFFAHWSLGAYFKTVPLALQVFIDPLRSSYLASALLKLAIQLLLIWQLATCISGTTKWWKPGFILAAALITPLFQTEGRFYSMSIIDNSVTYTFFYALATVLLLFFFLPFLQAYLLNKPVKLNLIQQVILLLFVFILPFHGPLNMGVIAVVCASVLVYHWWKSFNFSTENSFLKKAVTSVFSIPKPILFYFSLIILVSVYSFYIGRFNNENTTTTTILERYPLLLKGLYQELFHSIAFPILLLTILFNAVILRRNGDQGQRIVNMLKWAGIFSIIYILMLPLGGYRSYRPLIISNSTFLPVTLVIFFFYGLTCWYILQHVQLKRKKIYTSVLVAIAILFSVVERPKDDRYRCEKAAIEEIARSPKQHVDIEHDGWCTVLSWDKITNPYFSVPPGKLLQHWGVTKEAKTFTTGK